MLNVETNNNTEKLFEIKTIKCNILKVLFESLKSIVSEANLIISNDGIKICKLDNLNTILIYAKLERDQFEIFNVNTEDPIILGIDIINMFRILKIANINETLEMSMTNSQRGKSLTITFHNVIEEKSTTSVEIELLNLNILNEQIPKIEFNSELSISSNYFQRTMKKLQSLGAIHVIIVNTENELKFTAHESKLGKNAEIVFYNENIEVSSKKKVQQPKRNLKNMQLQVKNCNQAIVSGIFKVEDLLHISKASSLCNVVKIYLKNDYPIILEYDISSLGSLKFLVSHADLN